MDKTWRGKISLEMPGNGLVEYVLIRMHWTYTILVNFQRTVHGFRTQNASFPAHHLSRLSWKPQSWCSQGSQLPASPAILWADHFKLGNFQTLNTSPDWVSVILAILEALLYDLCFLPGGLMFNSSYKMDWILTNFLVEAGQWWVAAL